MGIIKLPEASLDFFRDNQDEIFESGNLAEGEWNKILAHWTCEYTVQNIHSL